MTYKSSQMGWVMSCIFTPVVIFLCLAYVNQWGNKPIPFAPFLVITSLFLILWSCFYKLTVTVRNSTLSVSYGIGLIRFRFKMDQLIKVDVGQVPWYYGLGIRITPKGMLYNIQGSQVVNITYKHGEKLKFVMVGTPEPHRLKKVLEDLKRSEDS